MTSVNFERPILTGISMEEKIMQLHDIMIRLSEQLNFSVNMIISEINVIEDSINNIQENIVELQESVGKLQA